MKEEKMDDTIFAAMRDQLALMKSALHELEVMELALEILTSFYAESECPVTIMKEKEESI